MICSIIKYIFDKINLNICLSFINFDIKKYHNHNHNHNHSHNHSHNHNRIKKKVTFSDCTIANEHLNLNKKRKIKFSDYDVRNDYLNLGISLTRENNGSITVVQNIPTF